MGRFTGFAAGAACVLMAMSAQAAPIGVDGFINPGEYGAIRASVGFSAQPPNGNFQSPGNVAAIAYDIFARADSQFYYAAFQARPEFGGSSVGPFANLYFDLDPKNANGSDLGFELSPTGTNAFIPGVAGSVVSTGSSVVTNAAQTIIELAIPISAFTGPIAGLTYYAGREFISATNPDVVLRLSQTFDYAVAGGASFGPDRLGRVTLVPVAVPEPSSIAILCAGLLGLFGIRRRAA